MINPVRLSLLSGLLVFSAGGCMSPAYLLHITGGELRSLSHSRPISQVMSKEGTAPDIVRKLELVQQVRVYARDCVGLSVGRAYTYYEDNAKGPVAYAVSGACRDRLEPYQWTYPIIGVYEAKGFFDSSLADKEAQRLRSKGYDATVSEVSGFSTLGVLPDLQTQRYAIQRKHGDICRACCRAGVLQKYICPGFTGSRRSR